MGRLTAKAVAGLREPGRYGDGDGLMLDVKAADSRYWTYRFQLDGKLRTMTFGSPDRGVSLTEARNRAARARGLVKGGVDPLAEKDRLRAEARLAASEAARRVDFRGAALAYITAHRAGWRGRGEEHWRQTLAQHVFPGFGDKPVAEVTADDVLRCLSPIWQGKSVTAVILRSRIELVLDYAKARGWRDGENPARWKGGLRSLLPPPAKVHRVEHRAALDWREAPPLMGALPVGGSMAERCLRFLMLTACRSGEVRGCRWSEIDMANKVWTIPADRMKGGREHRVPLSGPVMDILHDLAALRTSDVVFFGRAGLLDTGTLLVLLHRLGHKGITVHGFRSTFRDWCADTGKPGDLAEQALAHTVGNAVERSYRRSDVLDRRRALMDAWAAFLTAPPAVVIPLRAAG